jgi:hypothetical protein
MKEGMEILKDQKWCGRCKGLKKHWFKERKMREA